MERVAGVRIVDRLINALEGLVDEVIVVTNDPAVSEAIPDIRSVGDVHGGRGSLVGLHAALSAARQDVFALAWDMPFVTPALVSLVISTLSDPIYAAVPFSEAGAQPFCAAYSFACLPLLEQALDSGRMRAGEFVDSVPTVRRIGPTEIARVGEWDRLFFNVNSPGDLAVAERMARGT